MQCKVSSFRSAAAEVRRVERVAAYEENFGAKLVKYGDLSTPIEDVEETSEQALKRIQTEALNYVETIRAGFMAGADKVTCSCGDPKVVDQIKKMLQAEELPNVVFSFFDIPMPLDTVHLD